MSRHDHPTLPPEPTPEVLEQAMRRAHRLRAEAVLDVSGFLSAAVRRGARRLLASLRSTGAITPGGAPSDVRLLARRTAR